MLGSFSNGGLGFGVAFSLVDDFSQPAQAIERQMRGLDASVEAMAAKTNSAMNQMQLGAASLGVGLAGLAPMVKGALAQAEFEKAEIGLATLLGSAEKASQVFERIKQDAARTPFETQDLLLANQAIISQGIEADRSMNLVNNLGEALSAMGRGSADLSAMAINLQQIAANGRASSIDMKQFAMRGINMFQLVSESSGIAVEKLQEMPITLQMIEAALAKTSGAGGKYEGAMDRMSQSVDGKISTANDNIKFSFAAIGKAIEPITHFLIDTFIVLMENIQKFADSPIGKFVFRLVFALSALATILGVTLIATGALRLGMFKLATMFGETTSASIMMTIAQKGTTAGLYQMAVAVWAAIAPLIPFIAIGAAVIALGYGIYTAFTKGVQAFETMKERGTGVTLFLQRLGGYVAVIKEVWHTWDSFTQTFTLNASLEDKLKTLGIYENALAVATWVLRVKEFFTGVWAGMSEMYNGIKSAILPLWDSLKGAISSAFEAIGINIGKNTSDVERWKQAGKIAGYGLIVVVGLLTAAFTVMGVAALVSFSPILITLGAIALAVYGLIKLFDWLMEKLGSVGGVLSALGMPSLGIAFEGASALIDYMSGDASTAQPTNSGGLMSSDNSLGAQTATYNGQRANQATTFNPIIQNSPVEMPKYIQTDVHLDSEKLLTALQEKMNFNDSRK